MKLNLQKDDGLLQNYFRSNSIFATIEWGCYDGDRQIPLN